ncbi:GlcG/HbpS family heme-binding protein [Sinorhizobium alkalisoli]|uniref:GlcG/HbpS family heme-binding protein n=1 Tax=Sinorhizobium alkalisoli TaxID=1752398 RepID=UPI00124E7441|nr:heme-binding protein [Sinorhizobium alkalisoli]QFI68744.1 hypothetical protein EKH55_3870 [Sinorhizobium alkalisoli]
MKLIQLAKQLAAAAESAAEANNLSVTTCIVDQHGNVVMKQRMDGAILISIEMSERKAYTSAALRMRTAEMTALAQPGNPLFLLPSAAGGRYTALGGGVPIWIQGECVAGLGISGGTTEQDVEIAEAAVSTLIHTQ